MLAISCNCNSAVGGLRHPTSLEMRVLLRAFCVGLNNRRFLFPDKSPRITDEVISSQIDKFDRRPHATTVSTTPLMLIIAAFIVINPLKPDAKYSIDLLSVS